MGERAEYADERRLIRRVKRATLRNAQELKQMGVPCGLPLPIPGYVFAVAEGKSTMLERVRAVMDRAQKNAQEDSSSPDASPAKTENWFFEALHEETRAQWTREIYADNKTPVRQVYMIAGDFYSLDRKLLKVRLWKFFEKNSAMGRLEFVLRTLKVSGGIPGFTERRALTKLKEILSPLEYEQYTVTGAHIEIGKSGVAYLIRRQRPTIAMRETQVLCALCFHPIGYHEGTWAGGLSPTDEVVAHILMVRSDEHYFWKKANHISIFESNSGI